MTHVLLIASLLLSGCTSLMISDADSGLEKTGKVVARTLIAIPTFGLSEFRLQTQEATLECEERGGWYFMGACRANTQENRDRAMFMLPLMQQTLQQNFRMMQQPYQSMQSGPQSTYCSTYQQGQFGAINCY